jgi:diguanylate cyclase (GGDEF)-like protein
MLTLHRTALSILLLAAGLCLALYASAGNLKPVAEWRWMDIVGEGAAAVLAAVWTTLILGSRPSGKVTRLLAGGLAAITLGAWVDCLDEFFSIDKHQYWDNWLESLLTPGGMLTLTAGLYFWREEQYSLNEHMQKRERLFRDHRAFDRVTQLANADYLRRQLRLEHRRRPDLPCALVLLDLVAFRRVVRQHGQREGDRLLQAVSHLLLLNLRPDDLLCRYAGDRFAIVMPATDQTHANDLARHLAIAVRSLAHHSRDGGARIEIDVRIVSAQADADPESLLQALNVRLESAPPLGQPLAA